MVYYKRIPYPLDKLSEEIRKLGEQWKYLSIYFPEHKKHEEHGIAKDRVLIIVHK